MQSYQCVPSWCIVQQLFPSLEVLLMNNLNLLVAHTLLISIDRTHPMRSNRRRTGTHTHARAPAISQISLFISEINFVIFFLHHDHICRKLFAKHNTKNCSRYFIVVPVRCGQHLGHRMGNDHEAPITVWNDTNESHREAFTSTMMILLHWPVPTKQIGAMICWPVWTGRLVRSWAK